MRVSRLLPVIVALMVPLNGCGASEPARGEPSTAGEGTPAESASPEAAGEAIQPTEADPFRPWRDPQFAPLDEPKLQAMVEFMPGWTLTCSGHFALLRTPAVSDETARKILKLAETTTLELFRADPRATPLEPPLLRCVDDVDTFRAYGGAGDARAVYSEAHQEIVFLQFHDEDADTFTVLRDALTVWFKATSPREIEKRLQWLQQWADRRRGGGR